MILAWLVAVVAAAQVVALVVLVRRLLPGRRRLPPVAPRPEGLAGTSVSVVIPARNEAARIGPCLEGLRHQGAPLEEVIVVDGRSTDGTVELVARAAALDPRVRVLDEPPRPAWAVGRPWAIAAGCDAARAEWVLVVDADTKPRPGMVAGAVAAARDQGLDAVSFAPRIDAPGLAARWLQPSFLTTLVYRFGAAGAGRVPPHRTMANGQCMLMRREVLERCGGYGAAAGSFCDDVRMARHLASRGASVGFLDGHRLLDVVMYPTGRETWRAWPRSLNMRDATGAGWRMLDSAFLVLVQALPVPMLLLVAAVAIVAGLDATSEWPWTLLAAVNLALLGVRVMLGVATRHSFARRGLAYWLAPLADPAAALRVVETTAARPREWRGDPRSAAPARG